MIKNAKEARKIVQSYAKHRIDSDLILEQALNGLAALQWPEVKALVEALETAQRTVECASIDMMTINALAQYRDAANGE